MFFCTLKSINSSQYFSKLGKMVKKLFKMVVNVEKLLKMVENGDFLKFVKKMVKCWKMLVKTLKKFCISSFTLWILGISFFTQSLTNIFFAISTHQEDASPYARRVRHQRQRLQRCILSHISTRTSAFWQKNMQSPISAG